MHQSEIAGLMKLADTARTLPDAWQMVDPQRQSFLSRLGVLREQESRGAITPDRARAQERQLAAEFSAAMQAIVTAGRYIEPHIVIPEASPHQQAAELLAELRAHGVEALAQAGGGLALRPASRVAAHLRSRAAELRDHIVAVLDTLFIPGPPTAAA